MGAFSFPSPREIFFSPQKRMEWMCRDGDGDGDRLLLGEGILWGADCVDF